MSDDVKMIISGTFTVVILAWVIVNYQNVGQLSGSLAGAYGTATKAILPQATA